MAEKAFLVNIHTDRKYEILGIYKDETGNVEVELKGEWAVFREPYTKERMKQLGYAMRKIEVKEPQDEMEDERQMGRT